METSSASSGQDMLVTTHSAERSFELLPSRIFAGQLPDFFVTQHVHWYDHTNHVVELRPIALPWTSSKDQWRLRKTASGWMMEHKRTRMLAPASKTGNAIARIFRNLETPLFMHITLLETGELHVELPRLKLSFTMKQGSQVIWSDQFRGMQVDKHQSLGSLVGLRSKLVLVDEEEKRLVLIPDGKPQWKLEGDHAHVSIEIGTSDRTNQYQVETLLGSLVDDGTLQSHLKLCLLHAVTSYCLPDPLTGVTGTEKALQILRSASVLSAPYLTAEDIGLLTDIAKLSSTRYFYPVHLKSMQTVKWSSRLSFLSQSEELHFAATAVLEKARRTKFLYPDACDLPELLVKTDLFLAARARLRSYQFYVMGSGGEHRREPYHNYSSRGTGDGDVPMAYTFAKSILDRRQTIQLPLPGMLAQYLWTALCRGSFLDGSPDLSDQSLIRYDKSLLDSSVETFQRLWLRLTHALADRSSKASTFHKAILIAALAYAKDSDFQIVQSLVAIANIDAVAMVTLPARQTYYISQGKSIDQSALRAALHGNVAKFNASSEARLPAKSHEPVDARGERLMETFHKNKNVFAAHLIEALELQWPTRSPNTPSGRDYSNYFKVSVAMRLISTSFERWYDNLRLFDYLGRLERALRAFPVSVIGVPTIALPDCPQSSTSRSTMPVLSEDDIFARLGPDTAPLTGNLNGLIKPRSDASINTQHTSAVVARLKTTSSYHKTYASQLQKSTECLQLSARSYELTMPAELLCKTLKRHLEACHKGVVQQLDQLVRAAFLIDGTLKTLATLHMPRSRPELFLRRLQHQHWSRLSPQWQTAIVNYGLAITRLQQAHRLVGMGSRVTDIIKELSNVDHENWNPHEQPDSLLMEIESSIMIRDVQQRIATTMRDPPDDQNVVMQLNMGEGKSSVIAPIASASLADGKQLVRVIVAKPQSKQMLQMLKSKLSGLCDRRIYHMPFSRSLKMTVDEAKTLSAYLYDCMVNRGILLVQPEHILSFQLMAIESVIAGKAELGEKLIRTQQFFDENSRDLVDESDENFSPRFEIIYTMGTQTSIEFGPDRWTLLQTLLDSVAHFAPKVSEALPDSIEISASKEGEFPRTRFLRADAQEEMLKLLAEHVCSYGLHNLPIGRQSDSVRRAVLSYISDPAPSPHVIETVQSHKTFWTEQTSHPLLLVRGVLAGGVLNFALSSKRWRVNYGLDSKRLPRTNLALPYRAKDSPSPRSEFSHPDVVIILTCLSWYYGGLQEEHLRLAFLHLLKSDQAEIEYQNWIKKAMSLPRAFQKLSGINLKDNVQFSEEVYPHLARLKNVVDYFLAHIVFPKEMKEFPLRLSASGWDLGKQKQNPTTGFSGTNDSKYLLPLSVKHLDLPEQRHTNALVLEYLLQPINSVKCMSRNMNADKTDAENLIDLVLQMSEDIQVIIDVGAQILEMANEQVAIKWLERIPIDKQEAAIFFNSDDELCVVNRKGVVELLQTSPFARQLGSCIVFLDESHTRGTDLQMPEHYRAAVTLGPALTKDRLVQACMRLRKLGHGQSVAFCIPEEVRLKIMDMKEDNSPIDIADVLTWSINETSVDLQRSMPLWAVQGLRFQQQKQRWAQASSNGKYDMSKELAKQFLEVEAQSLEVRYKPKGKSTVLALPGLDNDPTVAAIHERCSEFEDLQLGATSLQEEQERELAPEIEEERQDERPPPMQPLEHTLHDDIKHFAMTGLLFKTSAAITPAFEALRRTKPAQKIYLSQFPDTIFVTMDFAMTVRLPVRGHADEYIREVQWVITSTAGTSEVQHLLVVSPFEAQELLATQIKFAAGVHLHPYAPRATLGYAPLDGLRLVPKPALAGGWHLPPKFAFQLNLFAGQLYFSSFAEYTATCDVLGIAWRPQQAGEELQADGFILKSESDGRPSFTKSPVAFLKDFLTRIRRQCTSIDKTDWGRVLAGEILTEEEFASREEAR